jgi:Cdc6-like AAA superfamily ATPase
MEDAAIAAAKKMSHAEVERRHVIYGIASELRQLPQVAALWDRVKVSLDPAGSAVTVPKITPQAVELLDSIRNEAEAIAAVVAAFGGDQPGGAAPPPAPQGVEVAQETKPAEPAKAEPPADVTTAAVLAELDALIGLGSVKAQVRTLIAVMQANQQRAEAGLPVVNPGLHLVFTGPPGTGKTTVARLIARLYASIGALPGSKFTEASRADLVAGYVGQTAIKTNEVIERSKPGVLFIDEAYALTPRHESDFGAEAIATLVKAMEDHRHLFAVIVAGYGDEMGAFIRSNPGLRSRFKTFIAFPNYDADEMTRIFEVLAANSKVTLAEGVTTRVREIFAAGLTQPDFGNARFARSLFEQAYARMAARAAGDGVVHLDEVQGIIVEDLGTWKQDVTEDGKRIGFQ